MKMTTQKVCISAVLMALVCIATLFFKVPIPLGYAHLGNAFIFLAAFLLDNPEALIVAGVGSALADMLGGYTEWIIPTLIIKCIMGFVIAAIMHRGHSNKGVLNINSVAGVLVGSVEMVLGYFIAGSIIYGNIVTGAAQIPGLISEAIVGIVLFYLLAFALQKTGAERLVKQNS